MATAEIAVAMPAVVFVLVVALAGIGTAIDQVRCVDAARAAARAASRGDPPATIRDLVGRIAPAGATVRVGREGGAGLVTVTVVAPVRLLGTVLPDTWRPNATAVGQLEDPGGAR